MPERSAFLKGSVILICANAAAKILGAVFKIPLTYVLREEGMAVYQTAFSVYIMMLSLVPGGFGFASTKLLGEYAALDRRDRLTAVVWGMAVILGVLGAAAGILMYIFARPLALAMREVAAPDAIRAISLAIIFVSVGTPVKSFNEADAHYMPTALSQVIEAAIKLFLGLFLARFFAESKGISAPQGALLGVAAGEAFQTLFLYAVWAFSNKKTHASRITRQELHKICSLAVPLTVTGVAAGALSMTETAVIRSALSDIVFTKTSADSFLKAYAPYTNVFDTLGKNLSLTADGIRKLYGAFSGYAQTVFNLPVGIAATVTAAATPLFSRALTLNGGADIEQTIEKALLPVYFIIAPSALVCIFFPGEVLSLIFSNKFASGMLMSAAPAMFFLCGANMLVSVLHLAGRVYEPFAAVMLSLGVKVLLTAVLVRIPQLNILGAGYAQVLSALCLLICTNVMAKKILGINVGVLKSCIKPVLSGIVMIVVMKTAFVNLLPLLGEKAAFLAACVIGGMGYIIIFHRKIII